MPDKKTAENALEPMSKIQVKFIVNNKDINVTVPVTYTLLDILRYELKFTGTKEGCGMGECGACTVIMNGELVTACLVLASSLEGKNVITIEGISEMPSAKPIIDSFVKHASVQCGFCTPGMVVASYALLSKYESPTNQQILDGLAGNICRCTGYAKIVEAINEAAVELSKNKKAEVK
ncbi:MAG: (2Fe-2S)-binding protein [Candidatus Wallbacteria bacterium]